MRLRPLAVTTALVLAVTGLSACTSKIGLAAEVGSRHLTLKTVDSDIKRGAVPYVDQQTGATVIPRQNVVGAWVIDQLIQRAILAKQGSALSKSQQSEASGILRQVVGGDPATVFAKQNSTVGYAHGYSVLEALQAEHLIALAHLLEPTKSAAAAFSDFQSSQAAHDNLLKSLVAQSGHVTVSARFGAWDPASLGFSSDPKAGLPSFVTIGPDVQPSTAPAAGQ